MVPGPFVVTHYGASVTYDPGLFTDDTGIIGKIRSSCCQGTITREKVEDFFADYLEDREYAFCTEAALREAYNDLAHVVSELLARLGCQELAERVG